jgi:hypothetical protein
VLLVFSASELVGLTCESVKSKNNDDLAYLAATGKIELSIRDSLGALITRKFPNLTAAREYQRRDLVILGDGHPLAIIEGKFWISFEANSPSKLHNPNPKEGLIAASKSDIVKMNDLHLSSGCKRFISTVLFAADIRQLEARHLPAVKYPNWHRRGSADGVDLITAHSLGVTSFLEATRPFGPGTTRRLFEGRVYGMTVVADVVICEVTCSVASLKTVT